MNLELRKTCERVWMLIKHKKSFSKQTFGYRRPAIGPLRAMIGDDEDDCVFIEQLHCLPYLLIEPEIVFRNRVLIGISGFELHVLFVEIIPKAVMHAVYPNIDKMKVIPFLLFHQPVHN